MPEAPKIRELYVLGKILILVAHLSPERRRMVLERARVLTEAAGMSYGLQAAPLMATESRIEQPIPD